MRTSSGGDKQNEQAPFGRSLLFPVESAHQDDAANGEETLPFPEAPH